MPFQRPSLPSLVTRIREDFKTRLAIVGSLLRRTMAGVLAAVWAGAVHMLHGHLEWLAKQFFADTAERAALLRKAATYGMAPTPATFASGTVEATGSDASVIPIATIYTRDDGVTYSVTTEATISGGTASVAVQAVEAGIDGNLDVGELLALESPIPGIDTSATVEDDGSGEGLSGGADVEDIEDFRARFLLRLREPPQGGKEADYEAWALAVAGVTRVWVYAHENGLGTVVVRFVRDDESPIIPSAGEVSDVQDALDAERPITAVVTAEAPSSLAVAFTVALTPDSAAVRAAVEAELDDLMFREAEPGDGAGRGTILLSQIQVAIGVAEGVEDFTLTTPSADVVPSTGELAERGAMTYV